MVAVEKHFKSGSKFCSERLKAFLKRPVGSLARTLDDLGLTQSGRKKPAKQSVHNNQVPTSVIRSEERQKTKSKGKPVFGEAARLLKSKKTSAGTPTSAPKVKISDSRYRPLSTTSVRNFSTKAKPSQLKQKHQTPQGWTTPTASSNFSQSSSDDTSTSFEFVTPTVRKTENGATVTLTKQTTTEISTETTQTTCIEEVPHRRITGVLMATVNDILFHSKAPEDRIDFKIVARMPVLPHISGIDISKLPWSEGFELGANWGELLMHVFSALAESQKSKTNIRHGWEVKWRAHSEESDLSDS